MIQCPLLHKKQKLLRTWKPYYSHTWNTLFGRELFCVPRDAIVLLQLLNFINANKQIRCGSNVFTWQVLKAIVIINYQSTILHLGCLTVLQVLLIDFNAVFIPDLVVSSSIGYSISSSSWTSSRFRRGLGVLGVFFSTFGFGFAASSICCCSNSSRILSKLFSSFSKSWKKDGRFRFRPET